jgi:hypothetical protein
MQSLSRFRCVEEHVRNIRTVLRFGIGFALRARWLGLTMSRRGINALPLENAGEKTPPPLSPSPVTERTDPIRIQSVALTVFAALSVISLLRYAQELFVPPMLAMLIAFALNPFVSALERCHVHRTIGSVVVVVAMFAAVGTLAYSLRNQPTTVAGNVPNAIAKLRVRLERYHRQSGAQSGPLGKVQEAAKELEKTAAEAARPPSQPSVTKVEVTEPARSHESRPHSVQ